MMLKGLGKGIQVRLWLWRDESSSSTACQTTGQDSEAKVEASTQAEGTVGGPAANEDTLLSAAKEGDLPAVEFALSAGVDGNCASAISGATPLYRAVYQRHLEVVIVLLCSGADPNIAAHNGKTPIDLCVGSDPKTREILRLLEIYKKRFRADSAPAVGAAAQMVRTESRPVLPIKGRRSSAAEITALDAALDNSERAAAPAPAIELV